MFDALTKIKEMHNEIMEAQRKKKELSKVVKEAFEKSKEYHDLADQMNSLRARKKQIEAGIRGEYSSEYNDLDSLNADIKDTKMVLSDLIWNELMKNNAVEIVDEHDNKYVPNVVVTLKKAG